MEWLGLAAVFIGLCVLGQSLPIVLICSALYVVMIWGDGVPTYLIEDMWSAVDSPFLLSIPMFLLAGTIMSRGAIAARLIGVTRELTNWLPGGLGVATILSCALFAAISGSSAVTMLSVGTILYPALLKSGYPKEFSLGAITSAGTLGIIIPPSIPLIIYGIVNEVSIVDLFVAGLVPGLLLTAVLAGYSFLRNRNVPSERFSLGNLLAALRKGVWAMLLPVILLGGIYSGYFSATEAAAVAVIYALFIEVFIHRELGARDLWEVCIETAQLLGTLIVIVAVILAVQNVLTLNGVQEGIADWVTSLVDNKIAFLIAVNILLLVAGCFIDALSAILILSPLLLAPAMRFGVDPLHFAIIMVVNLEIGLLTPPVGINLFVATSAFREKYGTIVRGTLPFVLLMVLTLLVITFVPELSLFLLDGR